jgi:hypothetical protein
VPDVYTVRRGDTLWDITGRYYGNPWYWPRVWSYNPEVTNPHWIYPLDRLRLRQGADGSDSGDGATQPDTSTARSFGGGDVFLREQGYLDPEALERSGIIIGSPEEQMLLSPSDQVYVRFDNAVNVRPGQELTVYREIDSDERLDSERGQLVRIFGTVRMRSYDPERRVARAVITEALDPIERGYRVAMIPRRFENVAPVQNDRDLAATVVAALQPRQLLADQHVIFVDAGAEKGVQKGNRFFVVRRGDTWRESRQHELQDMGEHYESVPGLPEWPEEIVAEARVVNVRPTTSVLVVTRAIREVAIGDRVEMRQGY